MTSSPHGPYAWGYTCYNGRYKGQQSREPSQPQNRSQFRLQSATRLHEVGIASNRGSACAVNTFPGLVHTARHTMGVDCSRSGCANPQGR